MQSNDEQKQIWNGRAGHAWVDEQALMDGMFAPLLTLLVESVKGARAKRVLDVGCGTGSSTLAIAALPDVHALGVDVSRPMLELATARAAGSRATFLEADAQSHDFEPYDMLVSRFGVMFFDDPVAAFANLRKSAHAGAPLHVLAWRSTAENPFMTTAERAALPLLPQLPPRKPGAPGQFAFADAERVRGLLQASGWTELELEPIDVACAFPRDGLEAYITRLGIVGALLPDLDAATRSRVLDTLRAAFAPYVHGDEVKYIAACWSIRARNA